MESSTFIAIFKETEALLEGHFKLSSGRHADKYVQCAKALQHPQHASALGKALAESFRSTGIDAVVSPALGGLIIGHEVAAALNVRFNFTERRDGEMIIRRGFAITPGERILVVEDVITTGKSTKEVVDVVCANGGVIAGIGCLANRSTGALDLPVPPIALLRLTFDNWTQEECPLCQQGTPITTPGSRFKPSR